MHSILAADSPIGHVLDHGSGPITMHTATIPIVGVLCVLAMLYAASRIKTGPESEGHARYTTKGRLAQVIEAMAVWIHKEMLTPVLGEAQARKWLPFLLSVFFFILTANLLGMIPLLDLQHLLTGGRYAPIGGTVTANLATTGALAFVAFIAIQIQGFRELGVKGWLEHLCGGLIGGPKGLYLLIPVIFVVEFAGLFIKPVALAIRLFANMIGGHTLLATLLMFGSMAAEAGLSMLGVAGISLLSGVFAVLIFFLEVFVAHLQAFVFMFLTAVFIAQMSHHDDHEHDEEHGEVAAAH